LFDTIREAVIDRRAGLPLKGEPLLERQLDAFESDSDSPKLSSN